MTTYSVNQSLLVKGGGVITSSSLATNMVIFNDPMYLYLAGLGALLSLIGLLFNKSHNKKESMTLEIKNLLEFIQALIAGSLITPLIFIMGPILESKIISTVSPDSISALGDSVWFLFATLTSWYSIPIMDYFTSLIGKKVKRKLK